MAMAEEAASRHDVSELWGKVEGLEKGFGELGDQVRSGFTQITNLIRESNDKNDRKVENLAIETRARFDREETVYRQTSQQRATTSLTIIGYLLTGIFSLGSLITGVAGTAFAFYSLTKAPIDQNFTTLSTAITKLETDFTPKAQVAITEALAIKNQKDIEALEQIASANTQARGDISKSIDALTSQVDILRTNSVSKGELALLNDRITLVSSRVTPPAAPAGK